MSNFFDLKKKLSALMQQSYQITDKLGYRSSAENILEIKDAFEKRELMIVTVGEAKRGKSSLLNAILNETEPLFPVDMNVCTNVVTIVRYGEKESVEICIDDPSAEGGIRRENIERSRIGEYVSEAGNPNNYKNINSLQITIPNEILKEGVVFVDTPGVGSLNISHAETTYNFLPSADMVLFVSDACSGYTESELDFLKRSYSHCKNIIFPVTKKDMSMNFQVIVDDDIKKITDTIGIPKEEIQIVPVSSAAKLRYLSNGNKSMYRNSNYEALENTLWSTIAKTKAEVLLRPFLLDLKQEIDKIHNSISTQAGMLDANQEEINSLIEAYNNESERVNKYQEDGAEWKIDLNTYFQNLSYTNNSRIQSISNEAMDYLDQVVLSMDTKICEESNYTALLMDINDIISKGTLDIKEMMEEGVTEQVVQIRKSLALDMDVNITAFERLKFVGDEKINIEFKHQKKSNKLINAGRNIGMDSMGGGRIGGILGGIVGGVLGIFAANPVAGAIVGYTAGTGLGGLLGGAKGCVTALSKHNAVDVNTVKKEISKYITNAIKGVSTMISGISLELKTQLTKIFDKDLKKRIKEIQENMNRIKENVNTAKSEIPKKKNDLKQQQNVLQKLYTSFDSLDKELSTLTISRKSQDNPHSSERKQEVASEKTGQNSDTGSYGFL